MTNDGTLITKAKNTKGGFPIKCIIGAERAWVDLAVANKVPKGFSPKGYVIEFREKDINNFYSPNTPRFSVFVTNTYQRLDEKLTLDEQNGGEKNWITTNDFQEAYQFFARKVEQFGLQNDCYLTQRLNKMVKGNDVKFDYLTFLREESNAL